MERNGLMFNRDYTTVPAVVFCSMLIAPFDVMAKACGVNVLRDASSQLGVVGQRRFK